MAGTGVTDDYFEKWNPKVNYRDNPHLYRIGRGQQGVLICEPYKSGSAPGGSRLFLKLW